MPTNPQAALQSIPWTPETVEDFTGGFTDDYIGAPSNRCQKNWNLWPDANGDLLTRDGSRIYNSSAEKVSAGNDRVAALFSYDEDTYLLAKHTTKISALVSGSWTELTGPVDSNDALPSGDANSSISSAEWREHLFVTDDAGSAVVKIFHDGSNLQVRTAGLPKMAEPENFTNATELANATTLANAIRTAMLAHFADTSAHRSADTTSAALVGSAASGTLATLLTLCGELIEAHQSHMGDVTGENTYHYSPQTTYTYGILSTLQASVSDMQLVSTSKPEDLIEAAVVLNELKIRYNLHDGGRSQHNANHGNHQVSASSLSGVNKGPVTEFNSQDLMDYLAQLLLRYDSHANDTASGVIQAGKALHATDEFRPPNTTVTTEAEIISRFIEDLAGYYNQHAWDAKGNFRSQHYSDDSSEFTNYMASGQLSPAPSGADTNYGYHVGHWSPLISDINSAKDVLIAHIRNTGGITQVDGSPASSTPHIVLGGGLTQPLWNAAALSDFSVASYNYALLYKYQYTVGTKTFTDRGPPLFRLAEEVTSISWKGFSITNIPTLSNGATLSYDTANIEVEIYRTVDGGDIYYLVDSIPNGTSSYTDTVTDTELVLREKLYVSGNLPDRDEPPICKYIHVQDNKGYYANCTLDGEALSERIYQSIPNDVDSVPRSFYVDLPAPVTGIGSYQGRVIAFTMDGVYRLTGSFDAFGRGGIEQDRIFSLDGCVSHSSIVEVPTGLVFAGKNGFYFTDGFNTYRISEGFNTTYAGYVQTSTQKARIVGSLEETNQRVWWSLQSSGGSDADEVFVLDTRSGISPYSSFSKVTNGANFAPTSLLYFNGQMLRGDSRGYVFKHDSAYYSDPVVDTGTASTNWTYTHVPYNFTTVGHNFGDSSIQTWNPLGSFEAKNVTDLSLQISIITNDDGAGTSLAPYRIRSEGKLIDRKFWMPNKEGRCYYRQIELTPATVVITNSDDNDTATVDKTAKTVTIDSGAWPTDPINWVIAFEDDGYATEFSISALAGSVLTVVDDSAELPVDGSYKWVIRGVPKDERLHLLNYSLYAMKESELADTYKADAGDTGANA